MRRHFSSISRLPYESIAESLTANMIMTARDELCVFKPDEKISQVLTVMEKKNYDVAPLDENGVIESFVERETLRRKSLSLPCEEVSQKIAVKHVISEGTKIERLLSLFTQQDFFFVVGQNEITGIVTYADLNKRAVKVLFYLLISELETQLLRVIKRKFQGIEDYLAYLTPEQRKDVEITVKEARKGNSDVSLEHYFSTSNIITILSKHPNLRSQLGFRSRKQAEKALNPLVDLRNKTMHPRPLLTQKGDVKRLKEARGLILELIQRSKKVAPRGKGEE